MKNFEFAIIASGMNHDDDYEDALFEAGCDDATISFQNGVLIAEFDRQAASFPAAIVSACLAIRDAGWKVERIEPDPLVSLSDIAERAGMSRQAISHYARGKRQQGFPAPTAKVASKHPLWDWQAVADWLFEKGHIDREATIQARILKEANIHIAAHDIDHDEFMHRLEICEMIASLSAPYEPVATVYLGQTSSPVAGGSFRLSTYSRQSGIRDKASGKLR